MTELGDEKKKTTVRIGKKDLLRLLAENEHYAQQVTDLQTRLNELLEENRRLKQQLGPEDLEVPSEEDWKNAPEDWGPGPGRAPTTPLPDDYRRTDIYFDGKS